MFVQLQGIKRQITIPSYIFDDDTLSIGAKGLYAQIFYSNDKICSLAELCSVTKNTEEELKGYFEELASAGYIEIGKNKCKLKSTGTPKKVTEEVVESAKEYSETVQEKPLSIYDKIKLIIDGFELSPNVKSLLLSYFEARLSKKGRFADAEQLHAVTVRSMVGELVSYHLTEEEALKCIQLSIDRQWFKFFNPKGTSSGTSFTSSGSYSFGEGIIPGTYTDEDRKENDRRAEELKTNGHPGYY